MTRAYIVILRPPTGCPRCSTDRGLTAIDKIDIDSSDERDPGTVKILSQIDLAVLGPVLF